jgi:hypothetical protein
MRVLRSVAAIALALTLALPGVGVADTSSVGTAELDAALGVAAGDEAQARETVRALLARDEVRTLAAQAGLDLRGADVAVGALGGDELLQLAHSAAAADAQLAGGEVITISLVSLLLIIIIIILIAD